MAETCGWDALGFDPAPGDPGALDAVAASWRRLGAELAAQAHDVRRLQSGLTWQGRAADACLTRLHVVPDDLALAADAFDVAGRAVETHASWLRVRQVTARDLEDEAAQQLSLLRTTADPQLEQVARDRIADIVGRARRLADETQADADRLGVTLSAACEHAPHGPDWFHRMLTDLGNDVHHLASAMHDVIVEAAPVIEAVADWCAKASSVLGEIGFVVSFVPGAGDLVGGFIVGASIALSATSLVGHALLASEGVGSWRAVGLDGAGLALALVSQGMDEPIAAEASAGEEAAAALPAPWRDMPYMSEKEFVLRAVRLHVDGAGAGMGAVDLARIPDDWPAMLGRRPAGAHA